jgi:hypothetical protein
MHQLFPLPVVVALVSCARSEPSSDPERAKSAVTPAASVCADTLLTDERAGPVRVGAMVDTVRAICRVSRDTTVTDMEGMPSRRLTVATAGDSVEAEIVDARVWRISITSPRFRTVDSLGVGTSISRLKQMTGARAMRGEGAVYAALPNHCGMSFQLTGFKPAAGAIVLQNLPPSVTVLRVLVFGCPAAPSTQ